MVTPLKTLMGFSVHLNVQLKFYNLPNVKSNGLPLTCYTLRTTVGTRLARLGDYSYASNRLGNSLAVYMRYYVKPFNRGYGELMDQYLNM